MVSVPDGRTAPVLMQGQDHIRLVDWRRPWLAPLRERGERVAAAVASGATVAGALNLEADRSLAQAPRLAGGRLRFVPQAALPEGEAYEAFIARTAQVPTRDNLHDFFNGLVWLQMPQFKRRLNELQAEEIARNGIGARRGALRDALTLLDENGALLQAPPVLVEALRERRWRDLFSTHRGLWRETRLTLVGHALVEKLVQPRKPITAHLLVEEEGVRADPVALLEPERLRTKPFLPLPVLGVPGWWPANEHEGFYDDPEVFRPLRVPPPSSCISTGTSAASSRGR